MLPLQAPLAADRAVDVMAVEQAVRGIATPGVQATVLDLKRESDALYAGYLGEALRLSLAGFAAIVLLLAVALRSAAATLRVICAGGAVGVRTAMKKLTYGNGSLPHWESGRYIVGRAGSRTDR